MSSFGLTTNCFNCYYYFSLHTDHLTAPSKGKHKEMRQMNLSARSRFGKI